VNTTPHSFGCNTCRPSSANTAWEAFKSLTTDIELVDESHFAVKIKFCRKCTQRFLSVFTETIDWEDSEDPQFWSVIPLTSTEVEQLSAAGNRLEAAIVALPHVRQSLQRDFPKGGDPRNYWSNGIVIGPHD
jgi:hypothetical protein